METIYENVDLKHLSGNKSFSRKDNSTVHREKDVPSSKGIKVLLIVLSVSLALAVGGLCVLGVLLSRPPEPDSQLMGNYSRTKDRLSSCQNFIKAHPCGLCEEGWTAHDGKCYFFSSESQTWFASRSSCAALDAHLVIINSEKEQLFLGSKTEASHWIGLNDLDTEGQWVWVNNQTLNETGVQFWYKRESEQSEPDNWMREDPSGENCASLQFRQQLHVWCDVSCQYKIRFICEKKYTFSFTDEN